MSTNDMELEVPSTAVDPTNPAFNGEHEGQLYYRGQPMQFDSIVESIYDIEKYIELLANAKPVVFTFEPGDSTRYSLCIVPLDCITGRFVGIPESDKHQWYHVTRLIGPDTVGSSIMRAHDARWEVGALGNNNPWTYSLFGWFLNRLLSEVEEYKSK